MARAYTPEQLAARVFWVSMGFIGAVMLAIGAILLTGVDP